ncbi:hypothetical protein Tco_0963467, partial [Tanacetum coccineum]
MCGIRGRFVLDFESPACMCHAEQDSGDYGTFVGGSTFGSSNVPRFLPDDRYDCLFRQSGSVETQGESSSAAQKKGFASQRGVTNVNEQHSVSVDAQ